MVMGGQDKCNPFNCLFINPAQLIGTTSVVMIDHPHFRAFRKSASLNPASLPVTISSIPGMASAIFVEISRSAAIVATMWRANSSRSFSGSSMTAWASSFALMLKGS